MPIVGGLRTRLIKQNFHNMIEECLDSLGWFDAGRNHERVKVVSGDQILQDERDGEPIHPNLVAITVGDNVDTESELGSILTDTDSLYYVDIYAENEAVGLHLAGDIKDIILGKFNSIGRTGPELQVFDLTQSTPVEAFWCEFENVTVDRAQNFRKEYERFWWMISFRMLDSYYGDLGPD